MDTCRKVISDVVAGLHATNLDDRIPVRLTLSLLKDKVKKFIKQDADTRRLFKLTSAWKRIPCVPMKEINFVECPVDVPCKAMMRSCFKIPETFESSYGYMLKVFNIVGEKEFIQTSLSGYKNIVSREWVDPNIVYFILMEGYIYVPDSMVDELTVYGLFKNPHEATKLIKGDSCLKPLDEEFPCPDYLLDPVKQDTKVELIKMYKGIPVDEKPNDSVNSK